MRAWRRRECIIPEGVSSTNQEYGCIKDQSPVEGESKNICQSSKLTARKACTDQTHHSHDTNSVHLAERACGVVYGESLHWDHTGKAKTVLL